MLGTRFAVGVVRLHEHGGYDLVARAHVGTQLREIVDMPVQVPDVVVRVDDGQIRI